MSSFLEKHKPGSYLAKVIDWGFTPGKQEGTGIVALTFQYENGTLTWWSALSSEFGLSKVADTLILLGLKDDANSLEAGPAGKALDTTKEVEIVVEHREYNGKINAGIAWVNDPNRSRLQKISAAAISSQLASLNAVLFQKRQALGMQTTTTQAKPELW